MEEIAPVKECYEPKPDVQACRYKPESEFYANPASKFGRGLTNTATGWIEVPKQIYLESSANDPVTGLFLGTGKGVIDGTIRTLGGAFDIVTFLFPPYGDPLVCPEFVFEGWETYCP